MCKRQRMLLQAKSAALMTLLCPLGGRSCYTLRSLCAAVFAMRRALPVSAAAAGQGIACITALCTAMLCKAALRVAGRWRCSVQVLL